jgi:hypothetical protein
MTEVRVGGRRFVPVELGRPWADMIVTRRWSLVARSSGEMDGTNDRLSWLSATATEVPQSCPNLIPLHGGRSGFRV